MFCGIQLNMLGQPVRIFSQVLSGMGKSVTAEQISSIIKAADSNGDGMFFIYGCNVLHAYVVLHVF